MNIYDTPFRIMSVSGYPTVLTKYYSFVCVLSTAYDKKKGVVNTGVMNLQISNYLHLRKHTDKMLQELSEAC
jgi:hypothetical protein